MILGKFSMYKLDGILTYQHLDESKLLRNKCFKWTLDGYKFINYET